MKKVYLGCVFVVLMQLSWARQCPPGPLGTGQFLNKPSGCATFGLDIEFTPQYSQLDDNAIIRIDWGDGSAIETINAGNTGVQAGLTYNTPVPHTYTEGATSGACIYEITAWVESSCYTIEETTVITEIAVFNTDNFGDGGAGITLNPMLLEVCAGTEVEVDFQDVSPWNCTNQTTLSITNNRPRWTRWVHGVFNDISGDPVLVDGNVEIFPFAEAVVDHSNLPVLDPQAPGNRSLTITVPATAQVGEEFHVRLDNWNQCNPYVDGGGVPTGLTPVSQTAIIRVIAPPDPAVNVASLGPYCVGEEIQFNYGSTHVAGYTYSWEFGDGSAASTDRDPTHTYTSSGTFDVTVTVDNTNISVSCEAITTPAFQITITPSPLPVISVEDAGGNPFNPVFCGETAGQFIYFDLDGSSVIPNPGDTEYTWNFYEKNSTTTIESNAVDPLLPLQHFFLEPGIYRVELIASDELAGCTYSTFQDITIYDNPVSNFVASEVCAGERTAFTDISDQLPVSVNGDVIEFWDWDFSYDGVNFNQELRKADNADFEWYLDGNAVAGEVEPAASVAGSYLVALRLITKNGLCSDIFFQEVTVKANPVATLLSDYAASICPNDEVTFTNASVQPVEIATAGPMQYQLIVTNLADGDFDIRNLLGTELPHKFENESDSQLDYEVILHAEAFNGCETESLPILVSVKPGFTVSFSDPTYDPLLPNCSPLEVNFVANDAAQNLNPDSYTWTIEGESGVLEGFPATVTNGSNPFHSFAYTLTNTLRRNMLYRVRLEAEKADVCVTGSQQLIRVDPVPAATFTLTESLDSCSSKTFVLQADEPGLVDYTWSVGLSPDQLSENGDRLELYFQRPDAGSPDLTGVVGLQTTNAAGCSSPEEEQQLLVENMNVPVLVDFSADPEYQLLPNSEVQIENRTSGGEDLQYLWRFGDGSTSTEENPGIHQYQQAGIYTISLEVTNGFCVESMEKTVVIEPTVPEVDFVPDRYSGCRPLTVSFRNTSQFADTTSFIWDFGDGQGISTLVNPSYTYSKPGVYTVTLQGKNSLGVADKEVKEAIIEVYEVPIAAFELRPREVYLPDKPVFFSNLSIGADSVFWDFGDGSTSSETDPVHYYKEKGNYPVTLVASNVHGCADTLQRHSAVEAIEGGRVVVPNAFTPNPAGPGGGAGAENGAFNDVFLPQTEGVTAFRMLIYNKWGQILYESTSPERGWDGYYQGRMCPQDVYVYRLELTYINGQKQLKMGDVTLIR